MLADEISGLLITNQNITPSRYTSQFYLSLANVLLVKNIFNFIAFYQSIYYIDVVGMTDIEAGIATSVYSSQILFLFLIGSLDDYIGVRDSMILASFIAVIDLILLILVKNKYFQVFLIGVGLPFVAVILFIALKMGIIATTTESRRSHGFSLYTALGYLSVVAFGPFVELIVNLQGTTYAAFHTIFIVIIALYVIAIILNYCCSDLNKPWRSDENQPSPLQIFREAISNKSFWKLAAVDAIGSISLGCLYQFGFVLPIYMSRELGANTNYGILIAVFSLVIAGFCPVFTPMVKYFSIYNCMMIGGVIIGIAPLVFAIGNDYYVIGAYMIINSIGGAIYESRVTDYNGKVAKTSSQGFYLSLVGILYSLLPLSNGVFGGFMLSYYCPADGERRCWIMWYLIGALSIFGSFLFLIFKSCIEDNSEITEPSITE